jgi:hypothetical protein
LAGLWERSGIGCTLPVKAMDAAVDNFRIALPANGNVTHPERIFLQGPHTRTHELRQIIRVACEMLRGFRVLHFVGPCVTVFGSARFTEEHPYYTLVAV